jgi:hypothetical protein
VKSKSRPKLRLVEDDKPADSSIFDDLDALRITPDNEDAESPAEEALQPDEASEVWSSDTFAMMSKRWYSRLREIKASGDLYGLAWVLLYRANLDPRFPVTSRDMYAAKVGTQHKRALLERLEAAGLIKVEWKPAPWVPWVTVMYRVKRLRKPK